MPTARKPCPTCSDPNLWALVEAVRPALLARAADRDAQIAYGRLVEAAKAYWPDFSKELQSAHPKAQPVVVKGRAINATKTL
jgi:hypothetical protein